MINLHPLWRFKLHKMEVKVATAEADEQYVYTKKRFSAKINYRHQIKIWRRITYYVERGKCGGTQQKPPPNRLLARGGLGLNKKLKRRRNWTTIFYGIIISPHMNERLKNLKFCRDLALMPGKRHVQPAIQLCDNSFSLFQTDYFPFMDSEWGPKTVLSTLPCIWWWSLKLTGSRMAHGNLNVF